MFVDYVEITVQAGNGGDGIISFHTEKYVPKGGPDGGDGGKGGNIIFVVDENLSTLRDYKYKRLFRAENGKRGASSLKTGRGGRDLLIPVPIGTIIRDVSSGEVIADLTESGQKVVIAKGGRGGKGNYRFKSSTNRAPRIFTEGEPGELKQIALELKLLADVGLVGLPNAGKSTLLSRLSSAKPKIADYPFTTLSPVLGIVKYGRYRNFVMADIPGLIEGASRGKGLGIDFLKHIERTKILVYIIDISEKRIKSTFNQLRNELDSFNPKLLEKPSIVALNKIDTRIDDKEGMEYLISQGVRVLRISAVTGEGLRELIEVLGKKVEASRSSE